MTEHAAIDGATIAWRLGVTMLFVLVNGFFVAAEFALVKLRMSRIEAAVAEGHGGARAVRDIMGRLDLYLSACQMGITLCSLVLGWLAEPAVATLILYVAEAAGMQVADSAWVHGVALALALTIVTILHMTIGEQAPKIWAIQRAESTAMATSRPLKAFTALFRPLIVLVNAISNAMLRAGGVEPHGELDGVHDVSELRSVIAASASAGHLTPRQRKLAENILGLVDHEVRHVLVPRVDVVSLDLESSPADNLARLGTCGHSRLPLVRHSLDQVVGVLHARDVLGKLIDGGDVDLEALARPALVVPDTQPLGEFVARAQATGNHCMVVVDEHGTATGLVFLEDALESIVGPIRDELDSPVSPDAVEVEPGVFEVSGHLALPAAATLLDTDISGEEDTIGGHLVARLGHLPAEGDVVELPGLEATVLSMGARLIERIRFKRVNPTN